MNIAVIGTGYVGLVTAAGLAEVGHSVVGADIDEVKVAELHEGIVSIHEPGLEPMVRENLARGHLRFTSTIPDALDGATVVMILVPTPSKPNGAADISCVLSAATDIAGNLLRGAVVATRSTVPVGTWRHVKEAIGSVNPGEFSVASNPEFLREGKAVEGFMKPDRIVIGAEDERAAQVLRQVYEPFKAPYVITDPTTAELIKYAANCLLATQISFVNDIARFAETVGADVTKVSEALRMDPRIGSRAFVDAGIGYGGSCLPKDVRALIHDGRGAETPLQLLEVVNKINEDRAKEILAKAEKLVGDLEGKTVAVWGLAFKPGTDDTREAPSIGIIRELTARGAAVKLCDPLAVPNAQIALPLLSFSSNPYEVLAGSDLLILATEWEEFAQTDPHRIKQLMRSPNVIDGRNALDSAKMAEAGLRYVGMGRGAFAT